MRNWRDANLLTVVEMYAAENDFIESEEELSKRFDNEIAPNVIEYHGKRGEASTDTVMMNEAFNEWTDILCTEGEIHPEQYNSYCYAGKYA